ncbi:MAG: transcriptional regulator, HxlR family [Nevskia sp.]|nr:transcriptional regulator, HxlR family [Nevskia sp.]
MPRLSPQARSGAAKAKSTPPVMELLELVGQRWTLRILWELRNGPLTFRALQEEGGGLSPTVLNRRLSQLKDTDLIELSLAGYKLTPLGLELGEKLLDLTRWAKRWARQRRTS